MANLIIDRLHHLIDTGLVTDDGEFLEYCILKEMVGNFDDIEDLENWKEAFAKVTDLIDEQIEHIAKQGRMEPEKTAEEALVDYFLSMDCELEHYDSTPPLDLSSGNTFFTTIFTYKDKYLHEVMENSWEKHIKERYGLDMMLSYAVDPNMNLLYINVLI